MKVYVLVYCDENGSKGVEGVTASINQAEYHSENHGSWYEEFDLKDYKEEQ